MMNNFPPPTEGVRLKVDNVAVYCETSPISIGSLVISEEAICFAANNGLCFQIPHSLITAFAISRSLTDFPYECLLLVISKSVASIMEMFGLAANANGRHSDEDEAVDNEEEESQNFIRLVPEDKELLPEIYTAVADMQVLCERSSESSFDELDEEEEEEEEEMGI